MSALAQKWGIVVIAERTANQERQINTLQELQPQRNIQSAGATLTEDARLELNNKWAWAIHENFLDIAERVQCIIEGRVPDEQDTAANEMQEAQSQVWPCSVL